MGDLAEVLGVSASGENGGEVVTPAPETENQESQTDNEGVGDAPEGGSENVADSQPEEGSQDDDESLTQTPEQRSKWAEMRREAERAKVLEGQLHQEQQWRDQFYADKFGKSHGIFNEAQYHAALERTQQEQQQQQALQPLQQAWNEAQQVAQQLQQEGYSETYINIYLNQQRALLQSQERQITLEQKLQREEATRQQIAQQQQAAQQQAAFNHRLVTQYQSLAKEFPDMVKKPEDIPKEVWQEFEATGKQDLVKAFKLANFDKLVSRNNRAAKQAALNSVNSKQHLKPDGGKGSSDVDTTVVPPEIIRNYKALNKNITDEQIIADYKKHNAKRR